MSGWRQKQRKDDAPWLLEKEQMVATRTTLSFLNSRGKCPQGDQERCTGRVLREANPETGLACRMHLRHVPGIPAGKGLEGDVVRLREKQSCDASWPEAPAHPVASSKTGMILQSCPRKGQLMWAPTLISLWKPPPRKGARLGEMAFCN